MASGFGYLNNAAVAAAHRRQRYERVAVLDVDVHHGNGTQAIFYERPDMPTVSIHADPTHFNPFVWGYAHERGDGPGLGANLNLPLALGTCDDAYQDALLLATKTIRAFAPDRTGRGWTPSPVDGLIESASMHVQNIIACSKSRPRFHAATLHQN